jgi:hypothetical protein
LSSLGKEMREFLLKSRIIGMLLQFIYQDSSPHELFFRDTSLFKPKYNENPDIGLPIDINKKEMKKFK